MITIVHSTELCIQNMMNLVVIWAQLERNISPYLSIKYRVCLRTEWLWCRYRNYVLHTLFSYCHSHAHAILYLFPITEIHISISIRCCTVHLLCCVVRFLLLFCFVLYSVLFHLMFLIIYHVPFVKMFVHPLTSAFIIASFIYMWWVKSRSKMIAKTRVNYTYFTLPIHDVHTVCRCHCFFVEYHQYHCRFSSLL